jgi:hypothetical protein
MAAEQQEQDRSELPTPYKLRRAREPSPPSLRSPGRDSRRSWLS